MNNPAFRQPSAPLERLIQLGQRVCQSAPATELQDELRQLLSAAEEGAWSFPVLAENLALSEAEAYGVALCVRAELGGPPLSVKEFRERVSAGRGGVRPVLFAFDGGAVRLCRTLSRFLLESSPRLPAGVRLELPEEEDLHDPRLLEELERFAARAVAEPNEPAVILLEGEPGSGRTHLFRRLAARLGCLLLCVSPDRANLAADGEEILLCAALYNALLCLEDPPPDGPAEELAEQAGLLLVSARPGSGPRRMRHSLTLRRRVRPLPEPALREHVASLLRALPVEPALPRGAVAALGRLPAGALRALERQIHAEHRATGQPVGWEVLEAYIAAQSEFAGPGTGVLHSRYCLEDMVLAERQRVQLRRICDFAGAWETVYREWGFAGKVPWGQGITALFYGPPGTGKTLAATAVANELGQPLYRVDLSQLISKYVGETQKNIGKIFDDAADRGGILFFDEADALFSRRSEAGDSQDKYANAEVAYLLQRTESHGGLCILATNLLQNFDEAFRRRITYMINFPLPDAGQRRRIWESIFPAQAPLEGLDCDLLAREFELSGASIKNCAVHAAYLAAAGGGAITMERVLDGVREEYAKQGKQLPPQIAGRLAEHR